MKRNSRRAFLGAAAGSVTVLAGCVDALTGSESDARDAALDGVDEEDSSESPETAEDSPLADDEETSLPVRESPMSLPYDLGALEADAISGGVPKDGIPSIDDPVFDDVSYGDDSLDPEDPVFGVEIDGVARAYPQYILVFHEIVNDSIDDRGIAVTYCPLTGTAIGFDRGDVEFGVSGMLVNSNLIMYDRATDSWWPQIHPTSPLGEMENWALNEFRVTWTTWERWKEVHPETQVLTEDTGSARNYGSDPYGEYNPDGGYYTDSNTMFAPRNESDEFHPKEVFIGARGRDGAVAFNKDTLREERLLEASVGETPYLAAYHEQLDSAWVYRNADNHSFEATEEGYEGPNGEVYAADEIPIESINAFDSFWFPWYGFYPNTEVVA